MIQINYSGLLRRALLLTVCAAAGPLTVNAGDWKENMKEHAGQSQRAAKDANTGKYERAGAEAAVPTDGGTVGGGSAETASVKQGEGKNGKKPLKEKDKKRLKVDENKAAQFTAEESRYAKELNPAVKPLDPGNDKQDESLTTKAVDTIKGTIDSDAAERNARWKGRSNDYKIKELNYLIAEKDKKLDILKPARTEAIKRRKEVDNPSKAYNDYTEMINAANEKIEKYERDKLVYKNELYTAQNEKKQKK